MSTDIEQTLSDIGSLFFLFFILVFIAGFIWLGYDCVMYLKTGSWNAEPFVVFLLNS
jgi:hypothetical protein